MTELEHWLGRAPLGSFFAVVRLLERATPGAVRIGGDGPPAREALRLLHDASLAFPAGEIRSVTAEGTRDRGRAERYAITSTVLGLTGSVSPLPLHISAEIAQEDSGAGGVRRAFLDVFHHRLLSLFYRSWMRYRLPEQRSGALDDAWSKWLQAPTGHDAEAGVDSGLTAGERLTLLPMLARRARTGEGLCCVLEQVLTPTAPGVQVRLQQFTGGAAPIQARRRMALGRTTAVLGRTAVLGARAKDPAGGFRLHIGPLPASRSADYVVGGVEHRRIGRIVHGFVREPLRYDMHLRFEGGDGQGFALSKRSPVPLGRQTFIRGGEPASEVVVRGADGERSRGGRRGAAEVET